MSLSLVSIRLGEEAPSVVLVPSLDAATAAPPATEPMSRRFSVVTGTFSTFSIGQGR